MGQAADLVGMPSLLLLQIRASQWRSALREHALASGITPLVTVAADVDLLDCLRSELNLRNAQALWSLQLARSVVRVVSDPKIVLKNVATCLDFQEIVSNMGPQGQSIRLIKPSARDRLWGAMRNQAYRVKTRLNRELAKRAVDGELPTHCDVLAIVKMPGHMADMIPVGYTLKTEYGLSTVFATPDRRLREPIVQAGMDWVPLLAPYSAEMRSCTTQLSKQIRSLRLLFDRASAYVPDFDVQEHAVMAIRSRRVLEDYGEQVLRVAFCVANLIRKLKPKLVVLGNPYTLEGRISTHVAQRFGLATASIEHGTIFPCEPNWHDFLIDTICCWGQPSRRALLSCGVPDERITVTGAPRHDEVFRGCAARDWPGEPATPSILVAASGPGDSVSIGRYRNYIAMLYEAADATPEIHWTIKLHKKDLFEYYEQVRPEGHPRVKIERGDFVRDGVSIFDYLRSAKGLVTICSTSALDAIGVGVPVIAVDVWPAGQGPKGIEFLERGCVHRVRTAAELAAAARSAWNEAFDPNCMAAARTVAEEYFANRGGAAAAVAAKLHSLISTRAHA